MNSARQIQITYTIVKIEQLKAIPVYCRVEETPDQHRAVLVVGRVNPITQAVEEDSREYYNAAQAKAYAADYMLPEKTVEVQVVHTQVSATFPEKNEAKILKYLKDIKKNKSTLPTSKYVDYKLTVSIEKQ